MADKRKGRRRPRGQYVRGRIEENLALGALASGATAVDTWDETVNEKSLISSIVSVWSLDQLVSPEGPIVVGVAHSDYSAAEITEVINASGSWDTGDKIQQEIGKRLVRVIGVFANDAGATSDHSLNDGQPIKTKLNWMLTSGDTLQMFAHNRSGATLTTGATLKADGHANLWQR